MTHRYPGLEIDEARREIRAADRILPMQPKIFDLLVFLAKNQDRVVPKRELLDALWPDVTVSEASLQRAVSLARSALADAGFPDAVRTYARQGYRFCLADEGLAEDEGEVLALACAGAHEAYRRGDWAAAIAAFREVDDLEGLCADDLRKWAHAAQCLGRPSEALPALERSVAAFTAAGEPRRAAWAALLCAHLHAEWAEHSVANGWLQRAARLLESEPPCRERGYLDMMRARSLVQNNRPEEALPFARSAREAGRTFGDPDIEGLGLVLAGEALLFLGETQAGLDALEEAGVSVVASKLSPWAGGLVYCCVIYSYMTRADWQRATQWTDSFTRWCEDNGAPAYPALCRMHRAEVLMVKGELSEAQRELEQAIETMSTHVPWTQGLAFAALGNVHLARGAFRDALANYLVAADHGFDATLGQALVRLYEGDATRAVRQLEESIGSETHSYRAQRGMSLSYLAIAAAAAGQLETARDAIRRVDADPLLASAPALEALLTRARGELLAAEGDRAGAITLLRKSLRAWLGLAAPLPAAEVRRSLAILLAAVGDVEDAERELTTAMNVFRRAGASGQLALCEQVRDRFAGERVSS